MLQTPPTVATMISRIVNGEELVKVRSHFASTSKFVSGFASNYSDIGIDAAIGYKTHSLFTFSYYIASNVF